MTDFDDNDFDIDELLDEIDSSGTKAKTKPVEPSLPAEGTIEDATSTDKRSGGGSSKSVRFSEDKPSSLTNDEQPASGDDFISKLPRSQREPSSSLRTMFFASSSESQTKPSSATSVNKPPTGRSSSASAKSSAPISSSKDDWLGISDDKGLSFSPPASPPSSLPFQRRSAAAIPTSSSTEIGKPTAAATTAENSSEEEDALFKDIGLTRKTSSGGRRTTGPQIVDQGPNKSLAPNQSQQRSRLGVESSTVTPPMSLGGIGGSAPPPKSTFSSSYLDELGMSPPPSSGGPLGSVSDSKSAPSFLAKHQPLPSTQSLLGPSGSMFPETQVQAAPPQVVPNPAPVPADSFLSAFSLTAPPVPPSNQQLNVAATAPGTKKKILKKDGAPTSFLPSSTLQLPTHLINEEELKAMSASLKTLYANQLELLEKSYREQMEFLSEANRRKEDLLKEEMKGMQADYEERLDRLRQEIRDIEHRQLSNEPHGLTALAKLGEQLNASIEAIRDVQKSQGGGGLNEETAHKIESILSQNIGSNTQEGQKVVEIVKSIDDSVSKRFSLMNDAWRNLLNQIRQNMSELMEASANNANRHNQNALENELAQYEKRILGRLETLGKVIKEKEDSTPLLLSKLEESDKALVAEIAKLQKLQRRTKEVSEGITLDPIVKVLESDREEEQRRRERLALQIKEMRRDLKRVLFESESRQEVSQKFSTTTEVELKTISQSIRDLSSQLKFSMISGPTHPENLTNQFHSSMQQTQAEMEMKLLREERQALSESMAQINVEKRKQSEEKIELEKQKLDFEKERDKIRNLEIQLKTKLEETEELQKKTETVRREEIQLTSEAKVKMRELEKEKSVLRDKLMDAEHRLRGWEQKLRQEKAELMREREFMDRLRDQLLCPACLKTNEHAGVVHPPPPPYIQMETPRVTTANNMLNPYNSAAHEYFNSRIRSLDNNGGGGGLGNTHSSAALDANDELFDSYYKRLFD